MTVQEIVDKSIAGIREDVKAMWLAGEKVSQAYADKYFDGQRTNPNANRS